MVNQKNLSEKIIRKFFVCSFNSKRGPGRIRSFLLGPDSFFLFIFSVSACLAERKRKRKRRQAKASRDISCLSHIYLYISLCFSNRPLIRKSYTSNSKNIDPLCFSNKRSDGKLQLKNLEGAGPTTQFFESPGPLKRGNRPVG